MQMMVSIDVPKPIIYQVIAVSFGLMALLSAWNGLRHLRTGSSRLIDPDQETGRSPIGD